MNVETFMLNGGHGPNLFLFESGPPRTWKFKKIVVLAKEGWNFFVLKYCVERIKGFDEYIEQKILLNIQLNRSLFNVGEVLYFELHGHESNE